MPVLTPAAKLFAIAYALFSGEFFLTMVAVLLAPALHHFLHRSIWSSASKACEGLRGDSLGGFHGHCEHRPTGSRRVTCGISADSPLPRARRRRS